MSEANPEEKGGKFNPMYLKGVGDIAKMLQVNQETLKRAIATAGVQDVKFEGMDKRKVYFRVAEVCRAVYAPDTIVKDGDVPKKAYEKEKYFAAKLKELDYDEKRGVLVGTDQVRAFFADFIQSLKQIIDNHPDQMEKDRGLSPAEVEVQQMACDHLLIQLREGAKIHAAEYAKKHEPDAEFIQENKDEAA